MYKHLFEVKRIISTCKMPFTLNTILSIINGDNDVTSLEQILNSQIHALNLIQLHRTDDFIPSRSKDEMSNNLEKKVTFAFFHLIRLPYLLKNYIF